MANNFGCRPCLPCPEELPSDYIEEETCQYSIISILLPSLVTFILTLLIEFGAMKILELQIVPRASKEGDVEGDDRSKAGHPISFSSLVMTGSPLEHDSANDSAFPKNVQANHPHVTLDAELVPDKPIVHPLLIRLLHVLTPEETLDLSNETLFHLITFVDNMLRKGESKTKVTSTAPTNNSIKEVGCQTQLDQHTQPEGDRLDTVGSINPSSDKTIDKHHLDYEFCAKNPSESTSLNPTLPSVSPKLLQDLQSSASSKCKIPNVTYHHYTSTPSSDSESTCNPFINFAFDETSTGEPMATVDTNTFSEDVIHNGQ